MGTAEEFRKSGCKYLGRLYSEMDCQAFVEKALSDIGIKKDLKGSNAWFREMTWVGSPAECKAKFGCIPKGTFLFIHKFDGGEEARGYHDGKGNASHIGIYTGLTAAEMVAIATEAGNTVASKYQYGDGAIHSSSSREHVATSKFAGKEISGGWNKVGLWKAIDYGETINKILNGDSPEPSPDPDPPEPTPTEKTAVVTASSGSTVNMRKAPKSGAKLVNRVPIGTTVKVLDNKDGWSKIAYTDPTGAVWYGWMMDEFLKYPTKNVYSVYIPNLDQETAYALVKQFPSAIISVG